MVCIRDREKDFFESTFSRERDIDTWEANIKNTLQKFGFIKRVDKGWITTVKDLESWRFQR